MKRSAAFLVSLLVTATAVVACGSGSAADVSSDAGTVSADPPTECGTRLVEGGRCVADTACCVTAVASESPANGYRCTAGKWLRDQACLPPPVCTTPVTGSLTRSSGGAPLAVSCVNPGVSNGVVSASVVLGSVSLELHLTRLPTAGEVVTLVPFDDVRAPAQQDAGADADAGAATQTRAGFQVGYGGGFSGFTVIATSVSGTITIDSLVVDGKGGLTSLHAKLDAQITGSAPEWNGKLAGSW